jgi:hypothetical protein
LTLFNSWAGLPEQYLVVETNRQCLNLLGTLCDGDGPAAFGVFGLTRPQSCSRGFAERPTHLPHTAKVEPMGLVEPKLWGTLQQCRQRLDPMRRHGRARPRMTGSSTQTHSCCLEPCAFLITSTNLRVSGIQTYQSYHPFLHHHQRMGKLSQGKGYYCPRHTSYIIAKMLWFRYQKGYLTLRLSSRVILDSYAPCRTPRGFASRIGKCGIFHVLADKQSILCIGR